MLLYSMSMSCTSRLCLAYCGGKSSVKYAVTVTGSVRLRRMFLVALLMVYSPFSVKSNRWNILLDSTLTTMIMAVIKSMVVVFFIVLTSIKTYKISENLIGLGSCYCLLFFVKIILIEDVCILLVLLLILMLIVGGFRTFFLGKLRLIRHYPFLISFLLWELNFVE